MSRDDPPKEDEGAVCVEFLDTQICVDENGSISVYTGVSDDDSDDGFRHVAAASSVVGGYVDSDDDIARRLREWADENRDRIAACILQARDISALVSENRDLKLEVEGLRAQLNERYIAMRVRHLEEVLAYAHAENNRMRDALRWYADPRNHFPEPRRPGDPDPAVVFVEEPPIVNDGGRRAREALEEKS